jgi:hypothetical protein
MARLLLGLREARPRHTLPTSGHFVLWVVLALTLLALLATRAWPSPAAAGLRAAVDGGEVVALALGLAAALAFRHVKALWRLAPAGWRR